MSLLTQVKATILRFVTIDPRHLDVFPDESCFREILSGALVNLEPKGLAKQPTGTYVVLEN